MSSTQSGSGLAWGSLMNLLTRIKEDVDSQSTRVGPNLEFLHKFGQTFLDNGLIDDRSYLYEDIIGLAASLPNGSGLRDDLSGQFIKTLWKNLEHPPVSYLGDQFKYRTADGSNNNIMYPRLGASNSPYARSVVSQHKPARVLPDPGLIFDTILSREGAARPHPGKISSTLFYFGTIIIHDIFRTSDVDNTIVKSSSYLDLGPLYGHNQAEQDQVRTFKDGLLKKDVFSESRILAQPPGVGALLVSFNRFHNWVVGELAVINENGKFSLPAGLKEGDSGYEAAVKKRDNDLFQTGRLITCGLYVNIILNDYLRAILNLNDNKVRSDWRLDPRDAFRSVFDPDGTPRGIGNQVSVEFNFIYRWHAAVSDRDEVWLQDFITKIFGPDVDPSTLTPAEYLGKLKAWFHNNVPRDPTEWTFGDLKRNKDGGFDDKDLVQLLRQGTDTVAGAFGAKNIPTALKAIEMLGIQQGREWGVATFNEFRQFFKLKPFTSFKDINSTEEGVAEALEALYGHPDNVELYPGLMAEQAKKVFSPGSGLCPGFTISEAILSDAVTLVRGDRFYAHEYGSQSLTSFGLTAASSDYDVAGGGVMYKLLMRAFPAWYRSNSVYALYPFNTPGRIKEIFASGAAPVPALDFNAPSFVGPPVPVISWQGIVQMLHDQTNFKVPWGPHTAQLTGHDYMLSGDKPSNAAQRKFVQDKMYCPKDTLAEVRTFYEGLTADLIKRNGRKLGGSYQIDIVQDIGNLAHAEFVGRFFGIPLRPEDSEHSATTNSYTPRALYNVLAHLFEYVFLDLDTAKSYKHLVTATGETKQLGDILYRVTREIRSGEDGSLRRLVEDTLFNKADTSVENSDSLKHFGAALVKRLMEQSQGSDAEVIDETVWTVIPTAAAACATQAQAWAQLIDIYLSDDYKSHWPEIQRLAQSDDPASFEVLKRYALEGFRLFPAASGVLRVVASPTPVTIPSAPTPLAPGATVFADFITAGRDPSKFPEPETIKLDRPYDSYIHHGWGPHSCLGRPIVETAAASMLRQFALLCPNLRRAPGEAGEMKKKLYNGAFPVFLSQDGGDWESFPVAKKVLFDGINGLKQNGDMNGY
ncbi:hypothetical protein QQS21_010012 [Conoideocrella luteorostrata]|uniref:Heme peroxidase n=1 Tax=Conoideocrella luteorostrata TaxID=1105319 RepID=A0AAJ0CGU7_9HYPO|nr:hypothetical protein QQS21_010012 [Conoideocrella luteorostrata]